ncbi:PAP fibrillin family protein [Gloeothece citriformis PCC 7424]|uniref:PAP fibrillin family protein n=1 Tax=Gloeothece citriformis (strain PCC 7424) TaxID=65393 RepID=B7KIM8_GLOC7|nr:PAP/fibrillin family protein [Gloeothece citriformis]ACK69434.1 PAP fibrillin family protein [Gloeothece citriformis PCC 7424]
MNNRQTVKEKLRSTLEQLKTQRLGNTSSPLTDVKLEEKSAQEIEQLTITLEALNPNLYPLRHALPLLDGIWKLDYSTAREIKSLAKLPYGFKVGEVYQIIDIETQSFFNQAFVTHTLGVLSGYVKVTATFEPAKEDYSVLPNRRLNVNFKKRYLAIEKVAGFNTPQLNPFKVVAANNPSGRIPSLDVTYLDDNLRIGRGGDGSLFILTKVPQIN